MTQENLTLDQVNQETSKIPWSELQRFFAQGLAVYVSSDLDLLTVAEAFNKDDKLLVEQWMQQQQVHLVSDQQATEWIQKDLWVWAVVIKPWILIQNI